jgi:hypothetical protein
MGRRKVVYLVRFPNGKIYVGKDLTDTITYFGSPDAALVADDFTEAERASFTVTREILWSSVSASDAEVARVEVEMIRLHSSNDPAVGYNRWPPFRAE